ALYGLSCKSFKEKEAELKNTATRGKINVSADEAFKPIITEMVKVYESNNPGTTIQVSYKAEADCLKDMFNDSVTMVIATRAFTPAERRLVADSLNVIVDYMVMARDAIALVVNKESEDSLFSIQEVKEILTGN